MTYFADYLKKTDTDDFDQFHQSDRFLQRKPAYACVSA